MFELKKEDEEMLKSIMDKMAEQDKRIKCLVLLREFTDEFEKTVTPAMTEKQGEVVASFMEQILTMLKDLRKEIGA